MASILKVNTIQDATNSNTALSIDSSGVVTTPTRPVFRVKPSSEQTLAHSTDTIIQYNDKTSSELFDIGGYFNTSNYRYVPQVAGYYCFTATIFVDAEASIGVVIRKNGTYEYQNRHNAESGDSFYPQVQVSGILNMNGSSDYVDVRGVHVGGSNKDLSVDRHQSSFFGYLLG